MAIEHQGGAILATPTAGTLPIMGLYAAKISRLRRRGALASGKRANMGRDEHTPATLAVAYDSCRSFPLYVLSEPTNLGTECVKCTLARVCEGGGSVKRPPLLGPLRRAIILCSEGMIRQETTPVPKFSFVTLPTKRSGQTSHVHVILQVVLLTSNCLEGRIIRLLKLGCECVRHWKSLQEILLCKRHSTFHDGSSGLFRDSIMRFSSVVVSRECFCSFCR